VTGVTALADLLEDEPGGTAQPHAKGIPMAATATSPAADLADIQPYPGPTACFDEATGTIAIGRYPDGTLAPWPLYRPGMGAYSGLIAGCSGSGVSTVLDTLGHIAAHTGLASVWAAGPLGGAGLPGAAGYAHWHAGGGGEILRMLRAAEQAAATRMRINAALRRAVYPVTPETPVILVLVDEADIVFAPGEAAELAAGIARVGRKAGVAVAAGVRDLWLSSFGGSEALRPTLAAGNVVALRSSSAVGARSFPPGLDVDPAALPRLPGAGLVAGHRPDAFRAWWPGDGGLQAAPDVPVELAVAARLGEDYTGRVERAEAWDAALRADLAEPTPSRPAQTTRPAAGGGR
jgi:hypothetical protein